MREVITTASAPSSPLFSQAVKAGQYVYVSGLVGVEIPDVLVSIRMTAFVG